MKMEPLAQETVLKIAQRVGTPAYVYDETALRMQAAKALSFPAPFGLTVRYAMKAAPNRAILKLFNDLGLGFDASSGFEVQRLELAGIDLSMVSLSTQELPENFATWVAAARGLASTSSNERTSTRDPSG